MSPQHTTRRAQTRYRSGRIAVAIAGILHLILGQSLRDLPALDFGGWTTGALAFETAGLVCLATAAWPRNLWLRVGSAVTVVAAGLWRFSALKDVPDVPRLLGISGAGWVWVLVIVLEIVAWVHVLPPPARPPTP